jgi:hypothetical protein
MQHAATRTCAIPRVQRQASWEERLRFIGSGFPPLVFIAGTIRSAPMRKIEYYRKDAE